MKKVLFTLVLGSLAAAAMAQQNNVLPVNSVVAGTHILAAAASPTCPPGTEENPAITGTPVVLGLVNPNAVAGVQARLQFDATKVELVNPAGTCYEAQEGRGITIGGGPSVVVNYTNAATGEVFFAIASSQGTSQGGPLITLFFKPKAGAAAGDSSPLTFDTAKFVVAGAPASGKNSVDGKLIIGGPNEGEVPLGAASGSASTDGTNVYGVDDRGVLTVAPTATLVFKTATQQAAARTGAPTEGRPVVRDGSIVIVSTNGKLQVFDATAANFASKLNPAGGVAGAGLPAGTSVRSTPAVANGKIFVTEATGNMFVFDLATGAQLATSPVGSAPTSSPAYVTTATGTRIVVGGGSSVLVLGEDLTPVAGVTIPATGGAVASSPYINGEGIGWVGTDGGQVITFSVGAAAGPIGTPADAGGPVRSPIFGSALGAVAVNTSGKVTVVSVAGTSVGAGGTFALPAGSTLPAGQDLFGFQQAPIVRGGTLLIGDSVGNLHQATFDAAAGTVGAPTVRNFGTLPITALASPADGQVLMIANRTNILKTTF